MVLLQPRITSLEWIGPNSLRVRFSSECTGFRHQLYLGRQLLSESAESTDREIIASMVPGGYPELLTVIAVSDTDVGGDHGSKLPPMPSTRARISFSAAAWTEDIKQIEVYANTTPGGAVDDSNLVAIIPWEGAATYLFISEPLVAGTHTFRFRGRTTAGVLGTAADASVTVDPFPEDLVATGASRFTVSMDAGTASLAWSLP